MGGKGKNISDFSVIKRVLNVERSIDDHLSRERQRCVDKIAEARRKADQLVADTVGRLVERERDIRSRVEDEKRGVEDKYRCDTEIKLKAIESLAKRNTDRAVDFILGMIEESGER